jgi:hypothetical protein
MFGLTPEVNTTGDKDWGVKDIVLWYTSSCNSITDQPYINLINPLLGDAPKVSHSTLLVDRPVGAMTIAR